MKINVAKVAWRAVRIIFKLYPIVSQVYTVLAEKKGDKITKTTANAACEAIIGTAKDCGMKIGHTEAELVRSAIHYAAAKSDRYKEIVSK